MFSIRYLYIFLLLLSALSLHSDFVEQIPEVPYIFCLDGGGSKTALQILDPTGKPITLHKDGERDILIQGDCSNVVVVQKQGVADVFEKLFDDLYVGPDKLPVRELIGQSLFVGGFAGLGREEHKNLMKEVVEALGFQPKYVHLYTDVGMALELVEEQGAVLVSGTGSICFIKDGEKVKRVGGLGYRIGDNGSGYDMGLRAIKASIGEEYEYERQTSLTPKIKELFGVSKAINLIGPINANEEPPGRIASVAPIVFEEAWKDDQVALQIVEACANELGDLLAQGLEGTEMRHPLTYLVGGLFQNEQASRFIQMLCKAPKMQKLPKSKRPILVNVSEKMIPTLVVQEKLRLAKGQGYRKIASLPVVDDMSGYELGHKYNREFVTAEALSQSSKQLSQIFHRDHREGLELIHTLDAKIFEPIEEFIDEHFEKLTHKIVKNIKEGGRVYFVGRATSARICTDLTAQWHHFWEAKGSEFEEYKNAVSSVIAGESNYLFKLLGPYEKIEDESIEAINQLDLKSKDMVVFLSTSRVPNFSKGAVEAVKKKQAACYFFLNPKKVLPQTEEHFKRLSVHCLKVSPCPHVFSDNSNTHMAMISKFCLGSSLSLAADYLAHHTNKIDKEYAKQMVSGLKSSWAKVSDSLADIENIVNLQINVFADDDSNFWKASDESYQGYVTLLSSDDCLHDLVYESIKVPNAFFSNPPCSKSDKGRKKSEYRAYHLGSENNIEAWESYFAGNITPRILGELSDFILSAKEQGCGDYIGRTIAQKNLILGCFSTASPDEQIYRLLLEMSKVKARGLMTALIVLEDKNHPLNSRFTSYLDQMDQSLIIPDLPEDPLHIVSSLTLKQTLNLITSGAMIGMNKVHGNVVIDLSASNKRMIEQNIRILQEIYAQYLHKESQFDQELLYNSLARAEHYKTLAESQLGKYIPSPAKVVLTMLEKNLDVEKAVALLRMNNENMALILNDI